MDIERGERVGREGIDRLHRRGAAGQAPRAARRQSRPSWLPFRSPRASLPLSRSTSPSLSPHPATHTHALRPHLSIPTQPHRSSTPPAPHRSTQLVTRTHSHPHPHPQMRSRSTPDDDDPLAAALRPPPDESPDTRALRLAREEDARRVSRAIDDAIRAERQLNKKRRIVRVLLLGQSESGACPLSPLPSAFALRLCPALCLCPLVACPFPWPRASPASFSPIIPPARPISVITYALCAPSPPIDRVACLRDRPTDPC